MRKPIRSLASVFVALAALALPLAAALVTAACSGGDGPVAVTGVALSRVQMTLTVGGPDGALTAAVKPPGAANRKMEWSASRDGFVKVTVNDDVATVVPVDATGAAGPVVVTVRTDDGGFTDTCDVKVVAVEGVTLQPTLSLAAGGPAGSLTAAVRPPDASQTVIWESDKPAVAEVAEIAGAAAVTPKAPGTAIITVKSAADGTKAATCTVTVTPAPDSVAIDQATLRLLPAGTGTLTATVLPAEAGQTVVWVSDNESAATVTGNGLTATVTAVAIGAARITATAAGFPGVLDHCDVAVGNSPVTMARTTIAAGYDFALAIKANGSLWAWGDNYYGQLGLGNDIDHSSPVQVGAETAWVSVSTGYAHTLAIKADGSLWAWGSNGFGQVGDGYNVGRLAPVRVGNANDWAAVATGFEHTVAIKEDGSLWAWGHNDYGQLGLGNNADRNVPTKVGMASDWAAVATRYKHTLAVKEDGSIWAWGYNGDGQLGLGGSGPGTERNVPTRVGADSDWTTVAAGYFHSLAVKSDGSVWAWGDNEYGQLGLGDNADRSVPAMVGAASDWATVVAGFAHTLAMKANGDIWAWGNNYSGQLGLGDNNNRNAPASMGTDDGWSAVATGNAHTLALKADGGLWACGHNSSGQLGLGGTTGLNAPTLVGGGWRVPAE